jgi:uncharacterized RDD family membrane protein YckC
MKWYYVNQGEAAGPISDEELLWQLRTGTILPNALVWRDGMAEWQPASVMAPQIVPAIPSPPGQPSVAAAPPLPGAGEPPVLPNFFCTMCGNVIPADQLVRISGRTVCAMCKPRYVQHAQEGFEAPVKIPVIPGTVAGLASMPDMDLADPGIRLVAYILDSVILGGSVVVGWFLLMLAIGASLPAAPASPSPTGEMMRVVASLAAMVITGGWMVFYWVFFIGRRGATPGMKIMRVKMVRADRGPVGYGLAFGRALLLYIINSFSMGLTNITAFFDKEKRTVVDMICGTRVVRN